jgi:hypothetical protein
MFAETYRFVPDIIGADFSNLPLPEKIPFSATDEFRLAPTGWHTPQRPLNDGLISFHNSMIDRPMGLPLALEAGSLPRTSPGLLPRGSAVDS